MAEETANDEARANPRKVREGVVISTKMDKTVVVAVVKHVRHRRYGKTMVARVPHLVSVEEVN